MKLNRDAILIRMAELQINRRQLAERSDLSYVVTCEALQNGSASTTTIGKLAQGLHIEVEKIVVKSQEVST